MNLEVVGTYAEDYISKPGGKATQFIEANNGFVGNMNMTVAMDLEFAVESPMAWFASESQEPLQEWILLNGESGQAANIVCVPPNTGVRVTVSDFVSNVAKNSDKKIYLQVNDRKRACLDENPIAAVGWSAVAAGGELMLDVDPVDLHLGYNYVYVGITQDYNQASALDRCYASCTASGAACSEPEDTPANPPVSRNNTLSCAQACYIRYHGTVMADRTSMASCKANCTVNELSGAKCWRQADGSEVVGDDVESPSGVLNTCGGCVRSPLVAKSTDSDGSLTSDLYNYECQQGCTLYPDACRTPDLNYGGHQFGFGDALDRTDEMPIVGVIEVSNDCVTDTIQSDYADSDGDGDGVPDEEDAFPNNSAETTDFDGDGIGDNADMDDDNDGVPDGADICDTADGTLTQDADGDGCDDATEDTDDDNDGVPDVDDTGDPWRGFDEHFLVSGLEPICSAIDTVMVDGAATQDDVNIATANALVAKSLEEAATVFSSSPCKQYDQLKNNIEKDTSGVLGDNMYLQLTMETAVSAIRLFVNGAEDCAFIDRQLSYDDSEMTVCADAADRSTCIFVHLVKAEGLLENEGADERFTDTFKCVASKYMDTCGGDEAFVNPVAQTIFYDLGLCDEDDSGDGSALDAENPCYETFGSFDVEDSCEALQQ